MATSVRNARRPILFRPLLLIALLAFAATTAAQSAGDFLTQYPGVYPEHGKALVERYLADNRAIEARGPVDVKALVEGRLPKDTPGIGPAVVVTEAMVRYNNGKYDPDNPLLNVAEYARKLGYRDILAYPTFGANDDIFMVPFPGDARDTLLVSQLNHSITSHAPIYPGDTLYLVANHRSVTDLTPQQGSIYRSLAIRTDGSIYNQRGDKVNDVVFRVVESVKVYRDDKRPPGKPDFSRIWEAPDWKTRPAHVYTDADWDKIRQLWRAEKRQGAKPLYWEDVKVGDQPAWTVDGPIDEGAMPTKPYGMGAGGNRTLKPELLDPRKSRKLVRGDDGIWRPRNKADYVPAVPDGAAAPPPPSNDGADVDTQNIHKKDDAGVDTADVHKKEDSRGILINFVGRDLAIRHVHNWIGDRGWLYNIRWGIMPAATHAALGKPVPENPDAVDFLSKVPFLQGRTVNAHPLTGDLFIVKSYVYDKYFRDEQGYAELAWWIETIDGYIVEAGGATVRLPSRDANLTIAPEESRR
ncbi:MAG: MaoC family dehydratase N-terminal domain-containing protein [Pseudoxanthomonas sp.]